MIKRISVGELRIGMFVHDMNCGWLDHPFLFNRLSIKSEDDLERVRATGVAQVYIDTGRGEAGVGGTERRVIDREIAGAMQDLAEQPSQAQPAQATRPLEEEMQRARSIHLETQGVISDMFHDARLGALPDLERLEPLVKRIGQSLAANAGALLMLARMKDADHYTFQHSVAVGMLLMKFADAVGYDADAVARIGVGGLLHDIGKMFIPDAVLNKPGALTREEFDLIKRHPQDGHALLAKARGIQKEQLDITRQHHERMDGRGYPRALPAADIAREARLAAIVDVYDALTSDRCYHRGIPPSVALRRLIEWSGDHFDTELVHHFVRCIGIYPTGSLVVLESGRIAIVTDQNDVNLLTPRLLVVYDSRKQRHLAPTVIEVGSDGRNTDAIVGITIASRWGLKETDYL